MFNNFGNYAPFLLIFLSWFLLWDKTWNNIFIYTIGLVISYLLNLILKRLIKQPRPNKTHKNGFSAFGMPSGHVQTSFYSTAFVFLILKDKKWVYIYLLISFIVMAQRVAYKHHTLLQVIVGAIVGISVAYGINVYKSVLT